MMIRVFEVVLYVGLGGLCGVWFRQATYTTLGIIFKKQSFNFPTSFFHGVFIIRNRVCQNHTTSQLKFKKQRIYNYCAIIHWVLQLLCNYPLKNIMY
jgi:hypothetical protein